MFKRTNRKNRRLGKVILPDLVSNIRRRADNLAGSRKRRLVVAVKLAFAGLLVYAFAAGPTGVARLVNLYTEDRQLQAVDRQLTAEIICLENTRRGLESDTSYIEKIAREDYGLSRPNEIIYLDTLAKDGR
jgi:cell division protein FtsB